MVDYSKELVTTLNEVLPTYYELEVTSKTNTPCITYYELNNAAFVEGNTFGYSRLRYQVKIWGKDIAALEQYSLILDAKLRKKGFTRTACTELFDNASTMIQKIFTYEALAVETFN